MGPSTSGERLLKGSATTSVPPARTHASNSSVWASSSVSTKSNRDVGVIARYDRRGVDRCAKALEQLDQRLRSGLAGRSRIERLARRVARRAGNHGDEEQTGDHHEPGQRSAKGPRARAGTGGRGRRRVYPPEHLVGTGPELFALGRSRGHVAVPGSFEQLRCARERNRGRLRHVLGQFDAELAGCASGYVTQHVTIDERGNQRAVPATQSRPSTHRPPRTPPHHVPSRSTTCGVTPRSRRHARALVAPCD